MSWRLLADVRPEDLRELLSVARRRTFAKGEVVFHMGDPADCLHLVQKGRFAAKVMTGLGDLATLTVYGAGDAFGEMALVLAKPVRSATVSALEPGETFAVYQADFAGLRRGYPAVGDVLTRLLAEKLMRTNERLLEALYVPADVRVRRCVLELAELYGGDEPTVPLTQEDLAGLAGTSRATVNRVLREEARRGSVELRRGKTVVIAPDELARRARTGATRLGGGARSPEPQAPRRGP